MLKRAEFWFLLSAVCSVFVLGINAGKCEADKPIDPRPVTTQYGRALDALSVVCLDGVEYWWVEDASVRYRATAIAPRYTHEGKVKLCEVEVPR